jgi:phosphoribosylanthranilate isomerase
MALGFNFYSGSPRYITPGQAAEIIAALPDEIWKVGVFVDEAPDAILAIARQAGLQVAQLHGSESPAEYPSGIRVWKAIRVHNGDGPRLDCPAEAVLLDGPASGQSFDWARIPRGACKLILAGGLDASNVRQAIEQVRPWGVDACSKLERAPGRKDHFKMAAFLKAARGVAA